MEMWQLMQMKRVLNYPGSKWNISEQIAFMIPKHKCYVEPFFGSGAVFFSKPFISPIETINDKNSDVCNLFECIKKDAPRLSRMVLATPYSRQVYENTYDKIPENQFEQALFFLIRCWQGLGYRQNGNKTGWKCDVMGREKMYAVWNWYNLPNCIVEVCERLRAVQIENDDAIAVIDRFDGTDTFMYLDPPYLIPSCEKKQYVHQMSEQDHAELLEKIVHCKANIMISGYQSDIYDYYLGSWDCRCFNTQVSGDAKRQEYLWMNFPDSQISIYDYYADIQMQERMKNE